MKNCLLLGALLMGFTGVAMAQSVTVDVPSGYKVVVVPDSVSVPQAVSVATVPQTVYVQPCCAIRVHSSFTTISTPPSLDHLLWPKTASLNFSFIFPFLSLSPFRNLIPIPCQTPARFPLHQKKPGRIYAQVFD